MRYQCSRQLGFAVKPLAAIFEPAHRSVEPPGKPCQRDLLAQQQALVAEAAADIGRDHADGAVGDAETMRETDLHDMRHLGRRHDREVAEPRIPVSEAAAAFDRKHALPGGAELTRHRDRRRARDGVDIGVDAHLQKYVIAPLLVDEGRAGFAGSDQIADGRQLVVVDLHGPGDVFGFGAGRCDAHGDKFTDVPHLLRRQDGFGGMLEARQRRRCPDRLHVDKVFRREHLVGDRVRDVDRANSPVRHGAAHERDLQRPRHAKVRNVLAAAGQQPLVLLARNRGTDAA